MQQNQESVIFSLTNTIVFCKYEQILILMVAIHPKKSWDKDTFTTVSNHLSF